MSKSSISTFELFQRFPDNEAARVYFEGQRWPEGPVCPACGERERIWRDAKRPGFYRCNADLVVFTVRTGTIFERSKVPLHKWLYAMYLLVTARKGISSLQLHSQIGVTQKTAWFMLQRLREACGNDPTELAGIVEIDECYIGGREDAKHETKRLNRGRGAVGKTPVIKKLRISSKWRKETTEALRSSDGPHCYYCGFYTFDAASPMKPIMERLVAEGLKEFITPRRKCSAVQSRTQSIEHLLALADHGSNDRENLKLACRWCNGFRDRKSVKKAKAEISAMVEAGIHPHQLYLKTGIFAGKRKQHAALIALFETTKQDATP